MAPLARALARLLGARYWLQVHGVDIWEPQNRLQRASIEAADLVTAVSRITRRRLLGWTDLSPDRVRVLPNTVREVFVPGPPTPSLAARLGVSPECAGPFILTVGRLASTERSKGHEQVFTAIADLRVRFPGLVYLIAGDGDDRQRLEECARQQGLGPECVRFLGWVPDEDLPDLYRLADLFVMPSTAEGFGIVFLEAAACGLRVVGGAGDGSIDTIQDSRVGETVDPDNRAGLVEAIAHGLAAGRVDPAVIAAYRRPHFAATARLLLAESDGAPGGREPGMTAPAKVSPRLILEAGRADRQYWRDLWRYRELFFILAWRDVAVRYKQTAIGVAWALVAALPHHGRLHPRLRQAGEAAQRRRRRPMPLLVFAGMLPWYLFSIGPQRSLGQPRRQRQPHRQGLFSAAHRAPGHHGRGLGRLSRQSSSSLSG